MAFGIFNYSDPNYRELQPNGPKDICKISNNCLVKTTRHLAGMFSRYLKRQVFRKSKQCLSKAVIKHLKKTSQRHLRSVSQTLLRQLTKPFFRYLIYSCFANLTNVWVNHCLDNLYTYLEAVKDAFLGV